MWIFYHSSINFLWWLTQWRLILKALLHKESLQWLLREGGKPKREVSEFWGGFAQLFLCLFFSFPFFFFKKVFWELQVASLRRPQFLGPPRVCYFPWKSFFRGLQIYTHMSKRDSPKRDFDVINELSINYTLYKKIEDR